MIGAASAQSYNEYVTVNIVERLDLGNTGPELDTTRETEYAAGYSALTYAAERQPIEHVDTAAMSSATGFYSTAEDLCRYFSAHFWGDDRLITGRLKTAPPARRAGRSSTRPTADMAWDSPITSR